MLELIRLDQHRSVDCTSQLGGECRRRSRILYVSMPFTLNGIVYSFDTLKATEMVDRTSTFPLLSCSAHTVFFSRQCTRQQVIGKIYIPVVAVSGPKAREYANTLPSIARTRCNKHIAPNASHVLTQHAFRNNCSIHEDKTVRLSAHTYLPHDLAAAVVDVSIPATRQLLDLSDRNLLCLSVRGDEAVFGSADHSLYCVDLSRGITTRQLYGSRSKPDAGHKEWVSVVCHTAQGDIASGGVDGKLCLWPRGGGGGGGGGNPGEVQAHAGSISAMKADEEGKVATSGYGGAVRVWDCRRSGGRGGAPPRLSGELSDGGLPAPCMDFSWSSDGRPAGVMTGHRDGRVGFFDAETGAIVTGGCKGRAHRGHVTVVEALDNMMGVAGCCFATGGQDGFVRIWDPRTGAMEGGGGTSAGAGPAAVLETPAHRGPEGVGAVGGLMVAGSGGNRLASFGADRRVCVLEVRGGRSGGGDDGRRRREQSSSLAIEHVFDEHRDFIYCMDFVPVGSGAARAGSGGDVLVTGGGDGMLLVHDLDSMRLLYGLGCCSTGAVRCAVARENTLTVAGDDGNAMLYSFGGDTAEEVGGRTPGRRK